MKINDRIISPDHPPLVIAEIGINHGGSLEVAKEMARLAAAAGCEMVKHQTHILEDAMTDEAKSIFRPTPMCQSGTSWPAVRCHKKKKSP